MVKYRARLHHKLGQAERAVALLEAFLCQFPDAADLTHINMLAELYMEAGRCAPARSCGTLPLLPSTEHRVIAHKRAGRAVHGGRAVRACARLAPCACYPTRA